MKQKKYWAVAIYLGAVSLIVFIAQFDGSKDYYGRDPASLRESPGVVPAELRDKSAGEAGNTASPCSERKQASVNVGKDPGRGPASTSVEATSGPSDCPE